jgi:hypothetical protein
VSARYRDLVSARFEWQLRGGSCLGLDVAVLLLANGQPISGQKAGFPLQVTWALAVRSATSRPSHPPQCVIDTKSPKGDEAIRLEIPIPTFLSRSRRGQSPKWGQGIITKSCDSHDFLMIAHKLSRENSTLTGKI